MVGPPSIASRDALRGEALHGISRQRERCNWRGGNAEVATEPSCGWLAFCESGQDSLVCLEPLPYGSEAGFPFGLSPLNRLTISSIVVGRSAVFRRAAFCYW